MKDSPYQVEEMMEESALSRQLKMFAVFNMFGYGSLWFVGENIWKAKLPESYVQREDRVEHPAICLQNGATDCGIHVAVPMWYGTTPRKDSEKDQRLIHAGKRYVLKNFNNDPDDADHSTMFGSFRPVPIEREYLGRDIVLASDFAEGRKQVGKLTRERVENERRERYKNIMRRNTARKLSSEELERLRRFTRAFLSLGTKE